MQKKTDNVDLALKINKLIHDECKEVPHDIGKRIMELVKGKNMKIDLFDKAYKFTAENEGGWSNNKYDLGGKTIYGISKVYHPIWFNRVHKLYKAGKITEAKQKAKEFYRLKFWNDLYSAMKSEKVAIRLFDVSANLGKKRAIKIFQKTLHNHTLIDISIDGIFGERTLQIFNDIVNVNMFYNLFKDNIEKYYRSRKHFSKFGKGWLNRLDRKIEI